MLDTDNFGAVRPGLERVDKLLFFRKKDGRGPKEKVNGRSEG